VIEKNLGNVERVLRLLTGIGLLIWAFNQHSMNAIDWFVAIVSLFLILNGIFSRCYLWYVLEINTCHKNQGSKNVDSGYC